MIGTVMVPLATCLTGPLIRTIASIFSGVVGMVTGVNYLGFYVGVWMMTGGCW